MGSPVLDFGTGVTFAAFKRLLQSSSSDFLPPPALSRKARITSAGMRPVEGGSRQSVPLNARLVVIVDS